MRFGPGAFAPIAVTTRSGLEESLFHGAGVALGPDGAAVASIGDPDLVIYARSALKPLQATAMVGLGLEVPADLLALVCASHDGNPAQLDGVRRLLDRFGLTEADLDNTPSRPYGAAARAEARVAGIEPSSLQQNCSGKHAGMLATCRINGWTTADYLDVDHPLQQAITATIERLGGPVHHIGVDGCGAPAHALSLRDLAVAFGRIARAQDAVASSMSGCPEQVGGPTRDVTAWMRAVDGLIAKEGAAGVMALGLPDGRAAALKIADGSDAARRAVTTEALRRLAVDVDGALASTAAEVAVATFGHGKPVGEVRPLEWSWSS